MSQNEGSSPLFFERYEIKYLIPESYVEPISEYISCYCELDYYSQKLLDEGKDGFYAITNLYLDTPHHQFYESSMQALDNGLNLRVRSYGSEGKFPYFLEVKYTKREIKKKFRTKLTEAEWQRFLARDVSTGPEGSSDLGLRAGNQSLFQRLLWTHAAEPKILTRYRRRAYTSLINDYARVTFDRDLRYEPRDSWNLVPDEAKSVQYDDETIYAPGTNVILELKCTTQVPLWFLDLIARFDLEQAGFSKYVSGISQILPYNYAPALTRHSPLGLRNA